MQAIIEEFLNSTRCSNKQEDIITNDNDDNKNELNKDREEECSNSIQNILQSLIGKETESTNDNIIPNPMKASSATAAKIPTPPSVFRLPISYLPKEDRHTLSKPVVEDLELITAKDAQTTRSLYSRLTDATNTTSSVYGRQFLHLWSETFTTNVSFLRSTQHMIACFREELELSSSSSSSSESDSAVHTQIEAFWKTMKTNRVGFKDKFGYIDASPFPIIEKLNTMPNVLQVLSIYNVSTPLISLMMPIILLIVPFFILKARGVDISVDRYTDVLKMLASTHAIGKLFTEFDSVSMEKKLYILMSVIFYFIQVYQNTMSCYRFYKNIFMIHDHLIMVRSYLKTTAQKMERILRCCSCSSNATGKTGNEMQFYNAFGGCLRAELQSVRTMCEEMSDIEPFSLSMRAIGRIGHIMKYYYMFFNDPDVNHMMQYTFGFNAYYEHLRGIVVHISSGALSACTFVDPGSDSCRNATEMKGAYFFNTMSDRIVKNDIVLDKKLIITGPNAAGKTTIIKTTLFNIILSQQIGFGAYDSATIVPYHFLHCYLNIPDTSGRDSLFQAESRRCKEILDCIMEHSTKRHFCIFDELYSGTNPYEAVASAYGYVDCISGMRNVDFMLTTHYIQLCELFCGSGSGGGSSGKKRKVIRKKRNEIPANPNIRNLHMETSAKDAFGMDYVYHYKVVPGISKVRGGIKVLVDLKYPESIIQTTKSVLDMKRC
jgi:hypothetical protein